MKGSALRFLLLLACLCLVPTLLRAQGAVAVLAGAEYGYYAPEIHEMYLRLHLQFTPTDGKDDLAAGRVTIDGQPVAYAFWYADDHTFDYGVERGASRKKMQVFVPCGWRAHARHEVLVKFTYNGQEGEVKAVLPTPATGGAWAAATGGNQAFLVREEAGLARRQEPVEFDVTMPAALFPDPEHTVRATLMRAPGVFEEIPCQTYDAEVVGRFVRFRATVQLTMAAKSSALVHLWSCPARTEEVPGGISLAGGALGGVISTADFRIELDQQSGQLYRWEDRRLKHQFSYIDARPGVTGNAAVIHRTPDVYGLHAPWAHAYDWKAPQSRLVRGPLFVETIRWGEMVGVPEIIGRVSYRFYAGRPEVRTTSSMRVTKDVLTRGLRVGNMIFGPTEFTHVAWPRQDGTIVRVPIARGLGNDMGAPPQTRFPVDTPWVVFYHREQKIGMAMVTPALAYFTEGAGHVNQSRATAYASLYRGCLMYVIRSLTQTYCADTRTYPTPLHAGDTVYEEAVYLPFAFTRDEAKQFAPVTTLLQELRNPLVVVP